MPDISGFGARVQVVASNTYPSGFNLTSFADDTDPFDFPDMSIADKAMGLNGDLITWSKATPVSVKLSVVPASDDHENLQVLFDANRVGKGKTSARDAITVTVVYPDGRTTTCSGGRLTDGPPSTGAASAGRLKTPAYTFVFENIARTRGQ